MNKLKLTEEQARMLAYNVDIEGYQVVYNEFNEAGRWESYHDLVILELSTGKYWASVYSQGLTESQSSEPFENDAPEFEEVFPHKIETIVYESVPQIIDNV